MNENLKPCPFCGTDLEDYPRVMTVHKARSEEYLKALLEHKLFQGSDAYFVVECGRCGSTGKREITAEKAIEAWNRRTVHEKDTNIV